MDLKTTLNHMTKAGLQQTIHIRCSELSVRDRKDLRVLHRTNLVRVSAHDGNVVRGLEEWHNDIFSNQTDGGCIRVDLTPAGAAIFSRTAAKV